MRRREPILKLFCRTLIEPPVRAVLGLHESGLLDDAGRPAKVLRTRPTLPGTGQSEADEAFDAMQESYSPGSGFRWRTVIQSLIVTTLVFMVFLGHRGWPLLIVIVFFLVFSVPLSMWWGRRVNGPASQIRDAWIDLGRCASCGYDLTNTEPEEGAPRGLRHCPECGHHWRLNRFKT